MLVQIVWFRGPYATLISKLLSDGPAYPNVLGPPTLPLTRLLPARGL